MRKTRSTLLLILALSLLTACGTLPTGGSETTEGAAEDAPSSEVCSVPPVSEQVTSATVQKDGHYTARDDVILYLTTYGSLPENYITEEEARALGWTGDNLEEVAPGFSLGGDVFTDVEGLTFHNLNYLVCDVDTEGQEERGKKRLVYVDDLSYIYYTEDGGETFQLVYRAP